MIPVVLLVCQFITDPYVGCKAIEYWCGGSGCLLSELECSLSETGNVWLPRECFKEE